MAIAKNKVLLIIVGVLLLTNIGMLLFFLNLKTPGSRFVRNIRGRHGFVEVLEKKVGFSQQQLSAYQELRSQHWTRMRPLMADMRNTKDSFYRMLYLPEAPDSVLRNAAAAIGRRQQAIDLQTFRHFQQVRNLCDSSQRPAFDSLIHQVVYKMSAPFRRDRDSLRIRRQRK